ncbi:hypothetical protein YC2023_041262 [Brassica napus]
MENTLLILSICKDKAQVGSWELKVVSIALRGLSAGNRILDFLKKPLTSLSLCASPSTLLEERCLWLPGSSDSFYSVESAGSDGFGQVSPYYEADYNSRRSDCDQTGSELSKHSSQRFYVSPPHTVTQPTARSNVLKDVMIWGATRGLIEGSKNQNDALSP